MERDKMHQIEPCVRGFCVVTDSVRAGIGLCYTADDTDSTSHSNGVDQLLHHGDEMDLPRVQHVHARHSVSTTLHSRPGNICV